MKVRAIRGATTVVEDSKAAIESAVVELVTTLMAKNKITEEDLISILFTATPDLKSEFPATAARTAGLSNTPLICAQELDIAGALTKTIRVMVHVYTAREKSEVEHIYLHGAVSLRRDLSIEN